MNRLAVFSLVALGAGAGAGTVVYANHMNKGGKGKAHGKLHGKHAHEAPHRHAKHLAKHGKTVIAGMHLDNVALGAGAGAALVAVLLWKPCACAPGAVAVPAGTPNAQLPPAAGQPTVPSTVQSNFGPIR